jgi:hypothetical protein
VSWQLLGRTALALVFFGAAAGKARDFRAFRDYLSAMFARHARAAAKTVLFAEAALGIALLVSAPPVVAEAGSAGFLLAATAVIAARLRRDDTTRCACWGGADAEEFSELGYARMARPAWYAARNGFLLLAVWLIVDDQAAPTPPTAAVLVAMPLVVMLLGAAASVARERHLLTMPDLPRRHLFAGRLAPLAALSWYDDDTHESWLASTRRTSPTNEAD